MESETEIQQGPGEDMLAVQVSHPSPTVVAESHEPDPPPQSSTHKRNKRPTRSELKDNQELKTTAKFDIKKMQVYIQRPCDMLTPRSTFSGTSERIRTWANNLPPQFFRMLYEDSKTLSAYANTENQPKHRQAEGRKIQPDNAFEAIGTPDIGVDLTLPRFERHVSWGTAKNPSSWISVFNHIHWAIRRARFHTYHSARIGHRISIATISTKGLTAATAHGHGAGRHRTVAEIYTEEHDVAIPIWIRDSAVPQDRSSIKQQQWEASGADLWASVTELRRSDFSKVSADTGLFEEILKKGHNYEWLCLGSIKKKHITQVMPWNGEMLHARETSRIVFSRLSPEKYVFDWALRQWRLNPKLYALAVFRDRKSELSRDSKQRKRVFRKSKGKNAVKRSGQNAKQLTKTKRKRKLDEDGIDLHDLQSRISRTNAEVWDLMISAQKNQCQCKDSRHIRAGSAQL